MKLSSLRVQNFRNHDDLVCEFSAKTTLLYGKNGSGKTALLEALYVAFRGVSFRGTDEDMLRARSVWYRIDTTDDSNTKRTVLLDNRTGKRSKQFIIDGKKTIRLPLKQKQPIVLFTPDDLRLIGGSPARRRKYLDSVIAQYDSVYPQTLRRYDRALLQRNKLLKQPAVMRDALFAWDVILSQTGAYIIDARRQLIDCINEQITDYYTRIAGAGNSLSVIYSNPSATAPALLAQYQASYDRDIAVGSTLVGPHRHDFLLSLNNKPADDHASRGEVRTIVLALKYIESSLLTQYFDMYPLVLLDDVFGELDVSRQKNLLSFFREHQVIITSTARHKADQIIRIH